MNRSLNDIFAGYMLKVMLTGTTRSMSYPFYHLYSADFWHPVSQPDIPHETGRTHSSVKRLRELHLGARFDDDLYSLLVTESFLEELRVALITKYFAKELQSALREHAYVNTNALKYSNALISVAEASPAYGSGSVINEQLGSERISNGLLLAILNLNLQKRWYTNHRARSCCCLGKCSY